MHNGWARLVIFLLGDPHLLEGGEGGQNGASDPYRVFTLRGSNYFDLHGGRGQICDFLLHTVSNTREHGGTTRQHSVGIQIFTDVDITLHDGVVGGLVDTSGFHTNEGWLEHCFRTPETLVSNSDDLAVRKLVAFLQGGGCGGCVHLLLEIKGDVAEFLLDVTDNLSLGSGGEGVAPLCDDLHEIFCEVTASQVQPHDGVGQSITLVDGDNVRYPITRVKHNTCGTTRSVQGQHGLDGDVHGGGVEGLEHDLCHLLSVGLGVEGSLCEQDWVLLRGHTQFVVEGVMPDLLHVIPVGDDAVLNGVFQGEETSLGLSLVTDIAVFLAHANHHTLFNTTR